MMVIVRVPLRRHPIESLPYNFFLHSTMGYNPRQTFYKAKWTGANDTRVKEQPLGEKVDVKVGATVVVDGDMAEHLRTQPHWEVEDQPCEAPKWHKEPEQPKTPAPSKSKSQERRKEVKKAAK